jgi:hypothetical protein
LQPARPPPHTEAITPTEPPSKGTSFVDDVPRPFPPDSDSEIAALGEADHPRDAIRRPRKIAGCYRGRRGRGVGGEEDIVEQRAGERSNKVVVRYEGLEFEIVNQLR